MGSNTEWQVDVLRARSAETTPGVLIGSRYILTAARPDEPPVLLVDLGVPGLPLQPAQVIPQDEPRPLNLLMLDKPVDLAVDTCLYVRSPWSDSRLLRLSRGGIGVLDPNGRLVGIANRSHLIDAATLGNWFEPIAPWVVVADDVVTLPLVNAPSPVDRLLDRPVVPEDRRYCDACGSAVGRSLGEVPGPVTGICANCATPFSFTPRLSTGDVVNDRYDIAGCLAQGGLSWIYLAEDRLFANRFVVLKEMIGRGSQAMALARAERYFTNLAQYPGIVRMLDEFDHQDESGHAVSYLVMAYVPGLSLRQIKNRARDGQDRHLLELSYLISYVIEVLRVLERLHGNGLLYCDVKPDNVIVGDARVTLIDLGGVRRPGEHGRPIVGTQPYQVHPDEIRRHDLTVRSDVYGVGVLLDELLRAADPPDAEPGFESLRYVADRAMADYDHRFPSATTMIEQLEGVLREIRPVRGTARSSIFAPAEHLIHLGLGDPPAAEPFDRDLLTEAVRGLPHAIDPQVDWSAGLKRLSTGDIAEASEAFERVRRIWPGEISPMLALALCAELSGDLGRARRLYLMVWRRDKNVVSAAFGLARVLVARGNFSDACAVLDDVPDNSPHREAALVASRQLTADDPSRTVRRGLTLQLGPTSLRLTLSSDSTVGSLDEVHGNFQVLVGSGRTLPPNAEVLAFVTIRPGARVRYLETRVDSRILLPAGTRSGLGQFYSLGTVGGGGTQEFHLCVAGADFEDGAEVAEVGIVVRLRGVTELVATGARAALVATPTRGNAELMDEVFNGFEAYLARNDEAALRAWGKAVQLATAQRATGVLDRLRTYINIEDARSGTIRLRGRRGEPTTERELGRYSTAVRRRAHPPPRPMSRRSQRIIAREYTASNVRARVDRVDGPAPPMPSLREQQSGHCPSCGIQIGHDWAFCETCGYELRYPSEPRPQQRQRQPDVRLARVWCDTDAPVIVGATTTVAFAVTPPTNGMAPLPRPVPVRVLLLSDHATTEPVARLTTLRPDRTSEAVHFDVTPARPGQVRLVFRVYREKDGQLLFEVETLVPVAAELPAIEAV